MKIRLFTVFAFLALSLNANASLIGFADAVLGYEDNSDNVKGVLGAGGFRDLSFTRALDGSVTGEVADAVLGDDDTSYLSLKIGQSIILAFINENIIDGVGDDIFVSELGSASETADVSVSSDGINFTFLGSANNANGISAFDLSSISFADPVTAIKIEGRSNGGSSPGFDLEFVQALNRIIVDPTPSVNTPSIAILFSLGVLSLLARRFSK
ncbi:hypothetical protein [Agaribacter marinus]|uniref:PEP-CTERM protein-sorting domain-containing protein n=1 Tax=Agaribacter marinus TaxID=1431249 RepID=A0AA37T040_9ALTE|nr:hypothetical protein [Agaribacter marinus]GLR72621.1 hypothetical protein GCM10007852_35290 [Agaribacter marinus]